MWARGSRRQRLDLRDDSSAAMPHSTVCTDCVQWGKVEYLQSWFKHNTTLILPPSSVHCVFLLQCNGNCSSVCGFANTKRVESNSRIWEFFPSGVPTISKLAKREPAHWQAPLCLHIRRFSAFSATSALCLDVMCDCANGTVFTSLPYCRSISYFL